MTENENIITIVQNAFEAEPRPEHFTTYLHCSECAEHDELLRSRDRKSLGVNDVNNPGWDPICYLTEEGWRYYLPTLVQLALESTVEKEDWYLPQLLFHLTTDGKGNRRVLACSTSQRKAITTFLWHMVATEAELINNYNINDEIQLAIEIWSENTA